MKMNTQDYLKKSILDTQEKVRDYMNYASEVEDKELKSCFEEFAKNEGLQAEKLQKQLKRFE